MRYLLEVSGTEEGSLCLNSADVAKTPGYLQRQACIVLRMWVCSWASGFSQFNVFVNCASWYLQSHGAGTSSTGVTAVAVRLAEHPSVRFQKYGALPVATTLDTSLKSSVLRKD